MLLQQKPQTLIFRNSGTHKKWEMIAVFIQPLWDLSHIPVSRLRQYIWRQIQQQTDLKQLSHWMEEQKSEEI